MDKTTRHKRQVLNLVRDMGNVSRPQIAQHMGLSLPTVTNLVHDLLQVGVLMENGLGPSQGGRRARLLTINPTFLQAVGVECSLLGAEAVLLDLTGTVLARESRPAIGIVDVDSAMPVIYDLIDKVLSQARRERLTGIGVGISGFVDHKAGVSIQFPRAERWTNVPIGRLLKERYDLSAFVVNDVQAATLGELRYGIGRGCRSFIYLHIGRGIRLGMVTGGELYYGSTGNAGEFGHMVVMEEGPVCYCGNYGCLESLAGPLAVVNQAREAISKGAESVMVGRVEGDLSRLDFRTVLQAASDGDRLAGNLLSKAGRWIGRAAANLANILDPELLIVGGNLGVLAAPLVEVINQAFRSVAIPSVRDHVQIRMSQFDTRPCSLGAGTIVFEHFFQQGVLTPGESPGENVH